MVHNAAPDPCIEVALTLLSPLFLSYMVDIWAKYIHIFTDRLPAATENRFLNRATLETRKGWWDNSWEYIVLVFDPPSPQWTGEAYH